MTPYQLAAERAASLPAKAPRLGGLILSRDGDLIRLRDKKSAEEAVIRIDDGTKVERTKYKFPFYRHVNMDTTALLPGLNIEAEGVGNSVGQLDARKISFSPDDFAIEVAEGAIIDRAKYLTQTVI